MSAIEDPKKQISYLQQCLASNKKPLGLFLGAGCPMSIRIGDEKKLPLIPDIAGITQIVREELETCPDCGPLLRTVDGHFEMDERHKTTVEDMLTHIRALHAVAGKGKVRDLSAKELDALDDGICKIIHRIVDQTLPSSKTPYHSIASWVEAVRREHPIEVFTTNYDLLMEQAFEDCRVPYFDGFAGVRKPFFDLRAMEEDLLPARWARLWKLHGSVNWYQTKGRGVFRGTSNEDSSPKRVIHPSHLKYQESRRLPYLAMIDRLRAFLKQPTATIVLCGYSFRDEHINEVIVQGLQSTQTAIAFALLFDNLDTNQPAVALATKRSNLSVLAKDGAVVSGERSKWPTRDAESVLSDSGMGIKWTPTDPGDQNSKRTAEFTLGDFAVFGQFLKELGGTSRQSSEERDAQ